MMPFNYQPKVKRYNRNWGKDNFYDWQSSVPLVSQEQTADQVTVLLAKMLGHPGFYYK